MLRHVVLLQWKPEIPASQVEAIAAALRALPAVIPTMRHYDVGPDRGLSGAGNASFAIVADFDDEAGWRAYDVHPAHEAARADLIRPWLAGRTAVQFEV
jgi:Ser/Thr protein kinase RdoA (MazF antagonist)